MTKQLILDIATFIGGLAAMGYFWEKCDKNNYCFPVAATVIVLSVTGWIGYRYSVPVVALIAVLVGAGGIGYWWRIWQRKRLQPDTSGEVAPLNSSSPRLEVASEEAMPLNSPPRLAGGIASLNSSSFWDMPGGTVSLNSPFYVERPPAEKTCYDLVEADNALIRIKAPRQMGKSSLLVRVLDHAKRHGQQSVCLSFQEADHAIFASLDQFLQWFCSNIANQLNLSDELVTRWQGVQGSKSKCTNYFEEYLLVQIPDSLVLGLDEVDAIFGHDDIAIDFFGLLRSWFEKGRQVDPWKRVNLVITHSQEVYIPLDMKQSPFNVGTAVELPAFTQAQVKELLNRYELAWQAEEIAQLMDLLGGHPYLVQVALYQIANGQMTLEKLIATGSHEEGPYSDHLRRHRVNLEEHPELAAAVKTIMASANPIPVREVKEVFKLRSMGLVKVIDDQVVPLCELYRRYFGERL